MKIEVGNIWDFHETHWVVIPTNIGWKQDGTNQMGVGLAKQAAERFPELPAWYGAACKARGQWTPTLGHEKARLLLFPTKPLDIVDPHLSWRSRSTIELVHKSLNELRCLQGSGGFDVAIPLVGCGAGGLDAVDVYQLLNHCLNDRFTLVLSNADHETLWPLFKE